MLAHQDNNYFFEITSREINGHKFSYYKILDEKFITHDGKFDKDLEVKISNLIKINKTFKTQIFFAGSEYLVAFDSEKKIANLGTARLGNEIFLLDQIESSNAIEVSKLKENTSYKVFKEHVNTILSLSNDAHPGIYKTVEIENGLTSLEEIETEEVKNLSQTITKELLAKVEEYNPVLFERVSDFALSLTARYALLRVHLLKFLAILPSLDHDQKGGEVKRILLESLRRLIADSKKAKQSGLKGEMTALPTLWMGLFYIAYFVATIFPAKQLAALIRFKVKFMAKRFIAGETIELAAKNFDAIFQTGRDVTLDQLGELVVSEAEADHYMNEVLKLVEGYSLYIKRGEKNRAGILRAHVSIKVSALCSDFKPEAFDYTYNLVSPRLKKILLSAKANEVFINIDAEHYHYRDVVFKIYKKLLLETPELKDFPHTGIVIQAYLRDGAKHLREVVELAKLRNITMPVRLVKGAYWDAETVEARAHGHEAPQFLNKEETDIHFREMVNEIFKSYPHLQLCLASHNFSDHAFAYALREVKYNSLPQIEHQCLHMTYEALSTALGKMNWAVRNYVPIGSLIVGMAYLVRRIMENSSQVGVLTIMRSHKKKVKLHSPLDIYKENKTQNKLAYDSVISSLDGSFANLAPLRTYLDHERATFESVKNHIEQNLHDTYKLGSIVNNSFATNGELIDILSPSDFSLVGKIRFADLNDSNKALELVDNEFYNGTWRDLDFSLKCAIFSKASLLMSLRRNELATIIMHESGKALKEALADVDEAVDFINYYIRTQKEISLDSNYKARGPAAIIAPWNFPIAIACGMTVASLVTGATVILKSAEQTPIIAQILIDLLHEAGIPKNAVIHLPGVGEIVGQNLVESPMIASIIFTGSKSVGVHITKVADKRFYKNKDDNHVYPVKVITEMGGKNAIIVTNNAELDETVSGILYSAFAHAGQKCSACSRVIVDNKVKDKLVKRLAEASKDINVGMATDFSVYINPMVTSFEKERIIKQVKEATLEAHQSGGRVHLDRSTESLPGNCVGPVIIELPMNAATKVGSFSRKELFAPVIHVIGFDTLEQAINIFNTTQYALTGGIYSQSQDDIDYCSAKMLSGNIYINRGITGARVAIEPFGGFKLSGTGPKAGGADYVRSLSIYGRETKCQKLPGHIENGSEYSAVLAKASGLSHQSRLERMTNALDEMISNFGQMFPGVFGKDKDLLINFRSNLVKDFLNVVEKPRDNRIIPGQLNYSLFNSSKQNCVFIALTDRPCMNTFVNALMAITCGLGVTVMCSNHKSYSWWKYMIDLLIKNRFSSRNIECYFVNMKSIKRVDDQFVDVFIVDTDSKTYEVASHYIESFIGKKRVPKIVSSLENNMANFHDLVATYMNERSFAVNIMRHGAPMEVSL